jgi:hypothetical protein
LSRQLKPYALHGMHLGSFEFDMCGACGRVYHPESTSMKIEAAAKDRGLWGKLPNRPRSSRKAAGRRAGSNRLRKLRQRPA